MSLGSCLFQARKKNGFSQDEVAERLGVSRQTISKWETDETLPDIRQAKRLAVLYRTTLDQLIEFDVEVQEIEEVIARTSEETEKKIDWTQLWAKKYPVLSTYPQTVPTRFYQAELQKLLEHLKQEQGYSDLDAMLVLKDILAHT